MLNHACQMAEHAICPIFHLMNGLVSSTMALRHSSSSEGQCRPCCSALLQSCSRRGQTVQIWAMLRRLSMLLSCNIPAANSVTLGHASARGVEKGRGKCQSCIIQPSHASQLKDQVCYSAPCGGRPCGRHPLCPLLGLLPPGSETGGFLRGRILTFGAAATSS